MLGPPLACKTSNSVSGKVANDSIGPGGFSSSNLFKPSEPLFILLVFGSKLLDRFLAAIALPDSLDMLQAQLFLLWVARRPTAKQPVLSHRCTMRDNTLP